MRQANGTWTADLFPNFVIPKSRYRPGHREFPGAEAVERMPITRVAPLTAVPGPRIITWVTRSTALTAAASIPRSISSSIPRTSSSRAIRGTATANWAGSAPISTTANWTTPPPASGGRTRSTSRTGPLPITTRFSPTLLNELRLGFGRRITDHHSSHRGRRLGAETGHRRRGSGELSRPSVRARSAPCSTASAPEPTTAPSWKTSLSRTMSPRSWAAIPSSSGMR